MEIQLFLSEYVFTGRLETSVAKGSTRSIPPQHMFTLGFTLIDCLRGNRNELFCDQLDYSFRSECIPKFGKGDIYVVGVNRLEGQRDRINFLTLRSTMHTQDVLEHFRYLPIGWKMENGSFVSPFTHTFTPLKEFSGFKCSNTGRPALLCPEGLEMNVEQVIEAGAEEKMAPFGDGKFLLTLRNSLDRELNVPALLSHNDVVSWADSLILIDVVSNDVWTFPGSGQYQNLQPTIMRPQQVIKTIVNVLTITGNDEWKAGGTRVYLLFCLGNICKQNFFYYYTSTHETLHSKLIGTPAFCDARK